jgi:hypothetical protein
LSNPIIQIVPRLAPSIDGIGDYALNLARELRSKYAVETHFIVGDCEWQGNLEIEGFRVRKVDSHTSSALGRLLINKDFDRGLQENPAVLLHYVGYGYAKRGCPFWLVEGLKQWKGKISQTRLVTMFHEVYAFGPPWRSSFWLSPLQRKLAANLSRLSDYCLASVESNGRMLRELGLGEKAPISVLPVFSNVGEPESIPRLTGRPRRLVVFGTSGRRLLAYKNSLSVIKRLCQALEAEEILDIGPPPSFDIPEIDDIPVVIIGEKPATEISDYLLNSIAGIIDYPADILAKSTIFAAYCAHGMIPIVVGSICHNSKIDGLEKGKHYCLAEDQSQPLNLDMGQLIAINAYSWYKNHSRNIHADTIAAYLTWHSCMK